MTIETGERALTLNTCVRLLLHVIFCFLALFGAAAQAAPIKILVFGDSLVSGYGLKPTEAFPPMLGLRLQAEGYEVVIANDGVPGETTAMGLARLTSAAETRPDLVILELGANDMLNNAPLKETRSNLERMIREFRRAGAHVVLAGMVARSDLPAAYRSQFDALYPELARKFSIALYPNFLAGVGGDPALTQEGGLHPNAAGVKVIVERISPTIHAALRERGVKRRRFPFTSE